MALPAGSRYWFSPINLLHYALSQPGTTCVLPGIATLEQLAQNLAYFTASAEQKDYSDPISKSRWNQQGVCMYCNHCQPCRAGIDISEVNKILNLMALSQPEQIKLVYQQLKVKASQCQVCGDCMERCPFGVNVVDQMKKAVELLEAPLAS